MTSSTVSSESAPRSSTNDDSFLISASFTPSCSATIFLTRCSTFSMRFSSPRGSQMMRVSNFTRSACPGTRRLRHVHPAIDVQRRAGDVACLARGEKSDCMSNLVRQAKPPEGYALDQRFALRADQRARHVGVDEAWRDAVDAYVAAAQLLRQRFGES